MKKLLMALLAVVMLSGCASLSEDFIPKFKTDIGMDSRLVAPVFYYVGQYGYNNFMFGGGKGAAIKGGLACTDESVLLIVTGSGGYEKVIEVKYTDVTDVQVPAWGDSRRLLIKSGNEFYTFELVKEGFVIDKIKTYEFYNFILERSVKVKNRKPVDVDKMRRDAKEAEGKFHR